MEVSVDSFIVPFKITDIKIIKDSYKKIKDSITN